MAQIGHSHHSRQQQKKAGQGGNDKRDRNQQFREQRLAKSRADDLDRFAGSSEDEAKPRKPKQNRKDPADEDGGSDDNKSSKRSKEVKKKAVQPVIEGKRFAKRARKELAKQKEKERIPKLAPAHAPAETEAAKTTASKKDHKKHSTPSPASGWQLKDGVVAKDLTVGNGKPAKFGYNVSITYTGSFPKDGKMFDNGALEFEIGTGQVVEGMEVGVAGMKVGGDRLITIPPSMGYGSEGSPPEIPGGATLEFRVQLLSFKKPPS